MAHHRHPRRVPHNGIDMVLLVYAANLLAHEREAIAAGTTRPEFDSALLEQAGAASRLADWRIIAETAYGSQAELLT